MCGICGTFSFSGAPASENLLGQMTSSMAHRGPDGSAVFQSGPVGLGHRRLSIIDLAGGNQPIPNEDETVNVVFNGEIYNFVELREELESHGHVFRTKSDTEVIVHGYEQWGLDCVKRFNGIFAFALWDERQQRLVLARDHFGVKPLYYTRVGNTLLFASEIKALLIHPECRREVDVNSLGLLFTLRYVPSPDTLFAGIKKLPPSHRMVIDRNGVEICRYWNRTPQVQQGRKEADLVHEYQALVEDVVRLQMRSDVPVGLFLSSGIDSGVLLALMSQRSSYPVQTFTIGFEGGDASNETEDARLMAQRYGARHSEMIVGPKDYQNYYDRYMLDLEEPVGNETAAAFYFVSLIASRSVKVTLSGQGADEPWAGYDRHLGVKLSQMYSRIPAFLTDRLLQSVVLKFVKNEKLRRGVTALSEPDLLTRLVKVYSFYSSAMKERLFLPWVKDRISSDGVEARAALAGLQSDVRHCDPLTQVLYLDTRTNLPDDLLMVGDKTSMANSLEARVPFLDFRLVEFIETLPPSLRLNGLQAKYLHKKALEKWLPKEVVYRKKKGFANPIHHWFRSHMREYVRECLLSPDSGLAQYFDQQYIRELIRQHETGEQEHLRQIYLLVSFELWHRQFIRSSSAAQTQRLQLEQPAEC